MKAEPIQPGNHMDIELYQKVQEKKRKAAQKRLAAVDRKYNAYLRSPQ